MRLGDIIERLDGAPQDAPIWYDFEAGVGEFHSWRGSYQDLTLAPTEDPSMVGDVLWRARQALTKTFYGYKGGDYEMNKDTPVWADQYGEASGRMILGIDRTLDGGFIIRTFIKPPEYIW